jgi:HlyD family secretion protein
MMRLKFLFCLWIVILVWGLTGCAGDDATVSEGIQASGFIEGKVYTIASSQGGQIAEVLVQQGDQVEVGDLLIRLDATLLQNARVQAQAGVDAAQATLDAVDEKPTSRDIVEAEAGFRKAEAELDAANAARGLLVSQYEPADPPKADLNAAQSKIDVAEAGMELAQAQLAQVRAGPLDGEREILEAKLKEAQANLRFAERQLEDMQLIATAGGVVLQIMKQEGEFASQGAPVLYLMDPQQLTLRIYVPVAKVAKIDVGDRFEVAADAYPDEVFYGSVVHIADQAQFTPATVLTQEERVKLVFAIELLVDDPSGKLKPGMPVDAWMHE